MYWLRKPPYLRYGAAALVVIGAFWLELRPTATVLHPFAAEELPAGTPLNEAPVDWREIPSGLLPPVDTSGVLHRPVASGSPILPADVGGGAVSAVPEGWWGIELPLPTLATPGRSVQIVVLSERTRSVAGVVLEQQEGLDPFGLPTGLVAIPAEDAVGVAAAAAEGRVAVLVEP